MWPLGDEQGQEVWGPRAHIPDSIQQDVNEEGIAFGGDVSLSQEYLVVATLHEVLPRPRKKRKRMEWHRLSLFPWCPLIPTLPKHPLSLSPLIPPRLGSSSSKKPYLAYTLTVAASSRLASNHLLSNNKGRNVYQPQLPPDTLPSSSQLSPLEASVSDAMS